MASLSVNSLEELAKKCDRLSSAQIKTLSSVAIDGDYHSSNQPFEYERISDNYAISYYNFGKPSLSMVTIGKIYGNVTYPSFIYMTEQNVIDRVYFPTETANALKRWILSDVMNGTFFESERLPYQVEDALTALVKTGDEDAKRILSYFETMFLKTEEVSSNIQNNIYLEEVTP